MAAYWGSSPVNTFIYSTVLAPFTEWILWILSTVPWLCCKGAFEYAIHHIPFWAWSWATWIEAYYPRLNLPSGSEILETKHGDSLPGSENKWVYQSIFPNHDILRRNEWMNVLWNEMIGKGLETWRVFNRMNLENPRKTRRIPNLFTTPILAWVCSREVFRRKEYIVTRNQCIETILNSNDKSTYKQSITI